MSEVENPTTEPVEAAGESSPEGGEKDWRAEAEKWKELSRKNEAAAKRNAEAAARLAEFEEAQKSEAQKLAERVEAAERAAAEAQAALLRSRIAAKHSVPEELLTGGSEEELEAQAAAFVAAVQARVAPAAPAADVEPGSDIAGGELSPEEIVALAAKR